MKKSANATFQAELERELERIYRQNQSAAVPSDTSRGREEKNGATAIINNFCGVERNGQFKRRRVDGGKSKSRGDFKSKDKRKFETNGHKNRAKVEPVLVSSGDEDVASNPKMKLRKFEN